MSDVGNISSCHSQDGSYFHCCLQEAKTGGPIAFLVKTSDISKLSEEEIQNEEIFADGERGIKGISPISRLRIRRYYNEENKSSIAIPETRIYGRTLAGFYESVKNFLLKSQPDLKIDTVYKEYKSRDIIRTGGSYTDSSDSTLFNRMFDTDTFSGSLDHEENDEGANRADQFEEELREFKDAFASDLKHCSVGFDVQDDQDDGGEVHYIAWGSLNLENINNLTDDFFDISITDPSDIITIQRYDETSENECRKRIPYAFKDNKPLFYKFKKFLDILAEYDVNFIYDMSGITSKPPSSISIFLSFGDDSNGISYNTDDFRTFCRDVVMDIDDKYDYYCKIFIKALYKSGFIESTDDNTTTELQRDEFINSLKHFDYDDDRLSINPHIFTISDAMASNYYDHSGLHDDIETRRVMKFLLNYLRKHFNPTDVVDTQMTFKQFHESYNNMQLRDYGLDNITLSVATDTTENPNKGKQSVYAKLIIVLDVEDASLPSLQTIKFLDDHYDDILNAIRLIVSKAYKINNEYTKNLERVYGKYLV
jgi:hypothetical protein